MRQEEQDVEGEGIDYHVPNLERALDMLELLADQPGLSASRIAELLDIPRNSVFRIIMSLLRYGYVVRDDSAKTFQLSRKLLALGHAATSTKTLVENAVDVMRELRDRTRETVVLGTLSGSEGVVIEQLFGLHPFQFMVSAGARFPLHCAAHGKALLAFLPDGERDRLMKSLKLVRYNERTLTTRTALAKELDEVRRHGYAVDRAEEVEGCHCVAAPILDRHNFPVAAICVTAPSDRMPQTSFPAIGSIVKEHAARISMRLGPPSISTQNEQERTSCRQPVSSTTMSASTNRTEASTRRKQKTPLSV